MSDSDLWLVESDPYQGEDKLDDPDAFKFTGTSYWCKRCKDARVGSLCKATAHEQTSSHIINTRYFDRRVSSDPLASQPSPDPSSGRSNTRYMSGMANELSPLPPSSPPNHYYTPAQFEDIDNNEELDGAGDVGNGAGDVGDGFDDEGPANLSTPTTGGPAASPSTGSDM
ncbi:uncharacterized protein PHACADRAFT_201464 [Phanerochaete carnosa HHB-10118-sp]|uniref:Uncharacterized protein n=1 Tax=Phanerochaete carnosa (strain HHB-10118-sp) TaxID=650164 RepID=K5VT67_PHACS|nr:uncharacterized protein PHACADRAFT_201464 [Phanerochaete carnosa HHB-10118-sp]EKM49769.1 hypothetical protein PHACADRAFT_201464 [Phanerochaete carnosa HHB-10118-sp]